MVAENQCPILESITIIVIVVDMSLRRRLVENRLPFKVTRQTSEDIASVIARYEADNHIGKQFDSVDELMKELLDD